MTKSKNIMQPITSPYRHAGLQVSTAKNRQLNNGAGKPHIFINGFSLIYYQEVNIRHCSVQSRMGDKILPQRNKHPLLLNSFDGKDNNEIMLE